MLEHRLSHPLIVLVLAALPLACGGGGNSTGPSGGRPASLRLQSGDAQWGEAGAQLPNPIVVQVEDANANALKGVAVQAAVISGDGQVIPSSYTTDQSGQARIVLKLGTHLRDTNRVSITVAGLPQVTATARADIPSTARITAVADAPATLPGDALATPVTTRVTLLDGRPLVGASIIWRIIWAESDQGTACACGTVGASDSVTDEAGEARAPFTMGADPRGALLLSSDALYFNPVGPSGITPVLVPLTWQVPRLFQSIKSGYDQSCALDSSGNAYCWGYNDAGATADGGEVGNGSSDAAVPVVPVSGSHIFASLALGAYHSCGLTAAQELYCWGDNRGGEYGDGTRTSHNIPTLVTTSEQFTSIAAGSDLTCGLTSNGTAYCWGTNRRGAVGDGTTTDRLTPTAVAGGLQFASIVMMADEGVCALTLDGHAYCWGSNSTGRLGDGSTNDHYTPQPVSGGLTFTQLLGGADHACGLTAGGQAYCWGDNSAGQLGDGTVMPRLVPTAVSGNISFQSLGAGLAAYFSCGIAVDGHAYCWGDDYTSELGLGPSAKDSLPTCSSGGFQVRCSLSPHRVFGSRSFTQLSMNLFSACGQTATEGAYCWGDDSYGENGDGFSQLINEYLALVMAPSSADIMPRLSGRRSASRAPASSAGGDLQRAPLDRRVRRAAHSRGGIILAHASAGPVSPRRAAPGTIK